VRGTYELLSWLQFGVFLLLRAAVAGVALGVMRRTEPQAAYVIAGGATLSLLASCCLSAVNGLMILRRDSDWEAQERWYAMGQCSDIVVRVAYFALVVYGLARASRALRAPAT
jgi:hypothetical protein